MAKSVMLRALGCRLTALGLVAHGTLRFTPAQSGVAALYGSLGYNRGESVRLRVEQE